MLNPKQQPMKCDSTTIGVIIPPRIMKTKIRFIEVGRFFICLGISWIAWMYVVNRIYFFRHDPFGK